MKDVLCVLLRRDVVLWMVSNGWQMSMVPESILAGRIKEHSMQSCQFRLD